MELKAEHSPVVRWIGRMISISPEHAYVLSLIINFGILIGFFWVLLKAKDAADVPRPHGDDSEGHSGSAGRQRGSIATLARYRRTAGKAGHRGGARFAPRPRARLLPKKRESARLRRKTSSKVVQAAEAEIAAIARNARRELKSYAASLAVDLASRKIRVDEPTDHALVREFVDQLGKDGK